MCGIIGALAFNDFKSKRKEKVRQESMMYMVTELLGMTQERGKDATGIAALFDDSQYMGLKMAVPAQEFISRFGKTDSDYEGFLYNWREYPTNARIVIGHCRKPSIGTLAATSDNNNNHPIKVGEIIGVHNGTLTNDDEIFSKLKCGRDGKVDSEAIFRLVNHFTNEGKEPFTLPALKEVCKRLSGNYAVLSFNGNNPYQLSAFRDAKPIIMCLIKPLKMAIIASEEKFIKAAVVRYNKQAVLYQTGGVRFSPLKKNDIEVITLPDDEAYIFDTRQDVTQATVIKDLYTSIDVPRVSKIWTPTVGPRYRGTGYSGTGYNKKKPATTPSNNTTGTPTATSKGNTNKDRVGRAWSSPAYSYRNVFNDGSGVEEHGNVEIECHGSKDVTPIMTEPTITVEEGVDCVGKFGLTNSDKPLDRQVMGPSATIEEIPARDIDKTISMANTAKVLATAAIVGMTAVESVDMNAYPDVVVMAKDANRKELAFASEDDMMDVLEVSNRAAFRGLSLHTIGNRIKNFFFERRWYLGYTTCLKEKSSTKKTKTKPEKVKLAEKHIRVAKNMTRVLAKVVAGTPVDDAVKEMLKTGAEFDSKTLSGLYRPGCLNSNVVIHEVVEKEKELE